jgi:integrase
MESIKAPGLKRVKRGGRVKLYWACSEAARKAHYPIKTVPLSSYGDDVAEIVTACQQLQGEMLTWLGGEVDSAGQYDGTIGGLIRLYTTHPESKFKTLKPSSRRPYNHYAKVIDATVGQRAIRAVKALEVKQWFANWSSHGAKPAAGHFALSVLKAALAFGQVCGHAECRNLREDVKLLGIAGLRPREAVFSAEQVSAIIATANAAGRPSLALATAIQFECGLRQWDTIGQWLPLDAPGLSSITKDSRKWFGMTWQDIGADNVLRVMPSKTEATSAARVSVDLSLCPMALEEISKVPMEKRTGPVIVSETTGLPYEAQTFAVSWRRIATAAGIPKSFWSRDLRASAVTEARRGGATTDDAAKVAGHTRPKITAQVYDRDRLEAARRFSRARAQVRNMPET